MSPPTKYCFLSGHVLKLLNNGKGFTSENFIMWMAGLETLKLSISIEFLWTYRSWCSKTHLATQISPWKTKGALIAQNTLPKHLYALLNELPLPNHKMWVIKLKNVWLLNIWRQWLASKNFGGIDLNLRTQTLFTFNSSRNSLENHNPFKSAGITATKWSHDMKAKTLTYK